MNDDVRVRVRGARDSIRDSAVKGETPPSPPRAPPAVDLREVLLALPTLHPAELLILGLAVRGEWEDRGRSLSGDLERLRREAPDLPPGALREMILAACRLGEDELERALKAEAAARVLARGAA